MTECSQGSNKTILLNVDLKRRRMKSDSSGPTQRTNERTSVLPSFFLVLFVFQETKLAHNSPSYLISLLHVVVVVVVVNVVLMGPKMTEGVVG